jgi:hypothetical protein
MNGYYQFPSFPLVNASMERISDKKLIPLLRNHAVAGYEASVRSEANIDIPPGRYTLRVKMDNAPEEQLIAPGRDVRAFGVKLVLFQ